jgi:hypothetical protein
MKETITMSLDKYNYNKRIIKLYEKDKTIITKGNGFRTHYTTIMSNDEAVIELSKRVKILEQELERTLCWWQKSKI